MIEMPVLSTENPTVNSADSKVPEKKLAADKSDSKVDFNKQLKKYQQKDDEGKDNRNVKEERTDFNQEEPSICVFDEMQMTFIIKPLLSQPKASSEMEQETTSNNVSESDYLVSDTMAEVMDDSHISVLLADNPQVETETSIPSDRQLDKLQAEAETSISTDQHLDKLQADAKTSISTDQHLNKLQPDTKNDISAGLQTDDLLANNGINAGLLHAEETITAVLQKIAAVTSKADIEVQNKPAADRIELQQVMDYSAELDDNNKLLRFDNSIQENKAASEADQERPTVIAENDTTKAKNDQNDIKKVIDFEIQKMKANKLTAVDESNLQQTGHDSQAMTDKAQPTEFKLSNAALNFQDKFQNQVSVKDVIEQIVEKVELIQGKTVSEISMELKPESLGKMTIKLVMEEGGLTAKFITDNYQTKNILENNLHSLKQTLEDYGIKVEKTEVNVQINSGSMFDGSEGNQQDKWQQHGYEYGLEYVEEKPLGDEQLSDMGVNPSNYEGLDMLDTSSMSFLV